MKQYGRKEIAFERVLFFSDAVVAIAITLLALELRLDVPAGHHLTFRDLLIPWHRYLAFVLSFINVAAFWRIHHDFFVYIQKMDGRMMAMNTFWLFCIVTLPFCTSLLSNHFGDAPAVFLYCLNVLLISVCQNFIWNSADRSDGYINRESVDPDFQPRIRLMLNLDMINAVIALALSFFFPRTAFFLLFFKLPNFLFATIYAGRMKKQALKANRN